MAQNPDAYQAAQDIMSVFSELFSVVPGTTLNIQRPAQNYFIIGMIPGDGSDVEEVLIQTSGENFSVSHRTIAR